jgi:hypothetical protein
VLKKPHKHCLLSKKFLAIDDLPVMNDGFDLLSRLDRLEGGSIENDKARLIPDTEAFFKPKKLASLGGRPSKRSPDWKPSLY